MDMGEYIMKEMTLPAGEYSVYISVLPNNPLEWYVPSIRILDGATIVVDQTATYIGVDADLWRLTQADFVIMSGGSYTVQIRSHDYWTRVKSICIVAESYFPTPTPTTTTSQTPPETETTPTPGTESVAP